MEIQRGNAASVIRVRATRLNGPVGRRLSRVSSRRLTAAFSRGITLVRRRSHD